MLPHSPIIQKLAKYGYLLLRILITVQSQSNCCNRSTEKLEKLNEQALRIVYQDKISSCLVVLKSLVVKNRYSTLANQRLAKMLITVFGVIGNGNAPTSISELLTARKSNNNLRGDAILRLPKVDSTKYWIKSWRHQVCMSLFVLTFLEK